MEGRPHSLVPTLLERLRDGRQPSTPTSQQGPHHKPQNLSVSPQPVGSVGTPEQVGRGRGTQVHCTARKLWVRAHLLGVQGDTTPGHQESLSL